MKPSLFENKYLRALGWTMIISASVHLLILGYEAAANQDWTIINYFNILDLDLFFPKLLALPGSLAYSAITALLVYALVLWHLGD